MSTRFLYVARHGAADVFGELTETGREQGRLLGRRLAHLPITAVWHSPLPRAVATAQEVSGLLGRNVRVEEAPELIDNVPYVPAPEEIPPSWTPFFDGYDAEEAAEGHRIARSLIARFAAAPDAGEDVHEVLITHAYPIAWLVRDAFKAPLAQWLGLNSANTALTVLEYRPGLPPTVVMFNEMSHLGPELRWTGFPAAERA